MNYQYGNYLMRNYPLTYDNEEDDMEQQVYRPSRFEGGAVQTTTDSTLNHPSGGFPPIYFCGGNKTYEDLLKEEKERKLRGYTTNQKAVSIKKIMGKRRNVVPFVDV